MRFAIAMVLAMGWLWAADANVTVPLPNKLDPVYNLSIDKHPKFEAEAVLTDGKRIRFCCVKSLLNFYYRPGYFPELGVDPEGKKIARLYVRDYLDGTKVDATKAWYVFGSRVSGPHGDDLIPFASRARAELFTHRFGGSRIMDFQTVKQKGFGLIDFLDTP